MRIVRSVFESMFKVDHKIKEQKHLEDTAQFISWHRDSCIGFAIRIAQMG